MPQRLYYRLIKGNLVDLTPRRFAAGYRALLHEIRKHTRAQIVLCTPTTLTEEPDAPVQALVDAYAVIVRSLATQQRLDLIDVRAAFVAAIAADPRPGVPYDLALVIRDMLATRWSGTTYEYLAQQRGYRLTCDGVHMAEAGADLVAQVVVRTLEQWDAASIER
jgi:hypothetical protein